MFCFQLLLAVAVAGMSIQSSNPANLLPSASSVVNMADSHDRQAFAMVTRMKDEPMDVESIETKQEEVHFKISRPYTTGLTFKRRDLTLMLRLDFSNI